MLPKIGAQPSGECVALFEDVFEFWVMKALDAVKQRELRPRC